MLKINQIKIPYKQISDQKDQKNLLIFAAAKKIKAPTQNISDLKILKRSLDARQSKKSGNAGEIFYQYSVALQIKNEKKYLKYKNPDVQPYNPINYSFPYHFEECPVRPVIIGFGPAGMFAGLMLARAGLKPVIYERGSSVHERMAKVEAFWQTGKLDTECNVQFGEGGAGTFSDGKLNTLVKDPTGTHRKVLETFVEFGAPEEILYVQKPHIGTDLLVDVVKNIREEILRLGGEIHFDTKASEIHIEDNRITGLTLNDNELVKASYVILAVGHSARDTYEMLYAKQMQIAPKPFAIGVRVEHPQPLINRSQYGAAAEDLPAADYKLTYQTSKGRSVYTFCMCPGGFVVNASSEEGKTAVNGMSYRKRDGKNANSAVIVNVTPDDFGSDHPLAGMTFQRKWEEAAYKEGGGLVPVQLFNDFKQKQISAKFGEVSPEHKGFTSFGNLWHCLPEFVCESLAEGINGFDAKLHGYAHPDAILSGVETRTSSPIKMYRDEALQSNIKGLFPCGEGAGYAGGITSAAMDGIKVAQAVAASIDLGGTKC